MSKTTNTLKIAKIFINGKSQAIRIPKEFRLPGTKAFIKKHGNTIVIMPYNSKPWENLFNSLTKFSEDFMVDRNQPSKQQHRDFF